MSYLYDNYAPALYGTIQRIVQQEEISNEVVQDVFLKIWDRIAQYDSKRGKLFTWMLNMARNAAIDKVRSKEIKQETKTDKVSDNVHTIDRKMNDSISIDGIGVKQLMSNLVEEQQFVLQKIYFEGYSHSEIADDFNIPLGTVKSRLRSALKHLRGKLKKEDGS